MPDRPIDPLTGPKYVLEGRVVTMGPQGVVPDGAIYIDAGEIIAVQPATQAPPAGFENAPRIRTGDSIYPGLIELHNHLSYNAMPLWDVPQRYSNNGQWKGHDDYGRLITKPSQVLGRTPGVVEALVRFVECKCLLGGVTTSQGITLSSSPGIRVYYKGIVRNVEQTDDPQLPHAGTRIGNPKTGGAEEYLDTLQRHTCYLQHLSEGVDPTARRWFLRLRLNNGDWAITNALCGIHSTALTAEDFRVVAEHGGSMVWSPLSNYLLYGDTVDIRAARGSGILMGIGSDWAPSGSKNLLGELKVAWLCSEKQGGVFTPKEILAMATINAAKILKWDSVLGSIESGKRADLVVVNGQQGDDYMRLIEARETSLTLVVINGVPRIGQKRLMERFGPGTEEIKIGRSTRVLNLAQETTHPLVRDLTLTEATRRLSNAMRNLPALARDLDNAAAAGLFAGSEDAQGTTWRVVFELEEEDEEFDLAAAPLADIVQSMELEDITVADEPDFLRKLVASRNLPEFVKKGLPPLYGEEIPLPEGARFLEETRQPVSPELVATTQDLKTCLRTWGELTLKGRKTIVEQALVLLERNYVHLPLKRAMHAVDPVQRLKLLQHRLEEARAGELAPEIAFHNEMTRIFTSLRDLHTTYRLPSPFKEKTAWLPFLIEECWEHGRRKYLVTKVVADAGPPTLEKGVEVVHWNGIPINRAIAQNAERRAGGNEAARHARGLDSLTIRPMVDGLPPDEDWVTLRYIDLDGNVREWTQDWLVFEPGRSISSLDPESLVSEATALGLDAHTDDIQEAKKVLFAGPVLSEEKHAAEAGQPRPISNTADGLPTYLPTVFRGRKVITKYGTFGYIRIFSFNVRDAGAFVDEFVRLAQQLPDDGLIIDVRGNAGGLIHAAERLLQVLSPRHIEPERAQFINSPLNLQICRNHAPSSLFRDLDLSPWTESIARSVETGATYSLGYSITPEEACNDVGQQYYGPVLLVTDALCYSATDIFAAGFQDHRIGLILGVSTNTGAGGANVWSHRVLGELVRPPGAVSPEMPSPYAALPGGADLRVAIRRTVRVGHEAGSVVEDLGITPDHYHRMTRRDLLEDNQDLIVEATRILASRKPHLIRVTFVPTEGALPQADVVTRNVTRLDVLVNGRPLRSFDVREDATSIRLQEIAGDVVRAPFKLELLGYDGAEFVAIWRKEMPDS